MIINDVIFSIIIGWSILLFNRCLWNHDRTNEM